jgi:hypothetical protein
MSDFEELKNPWSEYKLPDGRLMRVRHILSDVTQTGIGPDGVPIYNLNFYPVISIEPTEAQKAAFIEQARKVQETDDHPKGTLQ